MIKATTPKNWSESEQNRQVGLENQNAGRSFACVHKHAYMCFRKPGKVMWKLNFLITKSNTAQLPKIFTHPDGTNY